MPNRLILAPDDIEAGIWCTVHSGDREGCQAHGQHESYSHLKGLPLAVAQKSLPYVFVLPLIDIGGLCILDLRRCELCRVEEAYVTALRAHMGGMPMGPQQLPSGGGDVEMVVT